MPSKTSTKLNLSTALVRNLQINAEEYLYYSKYVNYDKDLSTLDFKIDPDFEQQVKDRIKIELRLYFKNEGNNDEINKLIQIQNERLKRCVKNIYNLFEQLKAPDINEDPGIKIDPIKHSKDYFNDSKKRLSWSGVQYGSKDSWIPKNHTGIFRIRSYDIKLDEFENDLIDLIEI